MKRNNILPLLLLISGFSCYHVKRVDRLMTPGEIIISGFNKNQLKILDSTFLTLKGLKANALRIPTEIYTKHSCFEELFGFRFNGERLYAWMSRRIHSVSFSNSWTVAVHKRRGHLLVGDLFFSVTMMERLYALIHEARHADGDGYPHIPCPKENYPFVSAGSPDMALHRYRACDEGLKGAYHYHSAFLFECYAYGLVDQRLAGLLYNSSVSRVLPLIGKQN